MSDILDFWPFPYKPRENQIRALKWMEEQDAKYLLLEAPVGSGKSNMGLTYSQYIGVRNPDKRGDSFILTPQRILQEQYEMSVKDIELIGMASLYGKGNYSCTPKKTTCDIGSIVKPKCHSCPFQKAKKKAQQASDTVLNYKLALTSFAYTKTFKDRKLMIMDECHALEQNLVDFDAFKVTERRCVKYKLPFKARFNDILAAHEWLREQYVPKLNNALVELEREVEPLFEKAGTDLSKQEIQKLREFAKLQDHTDEAMEMSLMSAVELQNQFVLTWDKTMFQFKRLTGEYSFNRIVKPMADRFLFMSSTILNKDGFCEDLGIPEDDAAFLSLSSEFDKANRPVYYMPKARMNAKWKQDENARGRADILDTITKLCYVHKDESGIIHTGNFEISKWLVDHLNVNHKVYHHNPDSGDDRNSVITAFQGDPKPSILISPSSTEGLDLKDDLGRFAIFVKVAYPYLGDQWVKRRAEISSEWYQRQAVISMVQGSGRIVRSADDWGNVYILDQTFAHLRKNAQYLFPSWWKESITII